MLAEVLQGVLIGGLTAAIAVGALNYAVAHSWRKSGEKPNENPGQQGQQFGGSRAYKVFAVFFLLLMGAGLVVVFRVDLPPVTGGIWIKVAVVAVGLYLSGFLLTEAFFTKLIIGEQGITKIRLHQRQHMFWRDVQAVKYSAAVTSFVLYSDHTRISVSLLMCGLSCLITAIQRHVAADLWVNAEPMFDRIGAK